MGPMGPMGKFSRRQRSPCPLRQAPVDPLKQHRQLGWRQSDLSVLRSRPHELALLQAFAEQTRTLAIPPNDLDQIAPSPSKDEHMPGERILLQGLLRLAASVAKPRRMSVTPAASQTFVFEGTGIIPIGHGSDGQGHQGHRSRRPAAGDRSQCRSRWCHRLLERHQPVASGRQRCRP